MCLKLLLFTCFLSLGGCGLKAGSNQSPLDPVPSGTLSAQGSFTGANGKTVSGVAALYVSADGGAYIVRVENLAAPSEAGLNILLKADGAVAYSSVLRSTSGNQNYATPLGGVHNFTSIEIFSSIYNLTYGVALLQ